MTLKTGLLHEKKCNYVSTITAHIISNIIALYDISISNKNLDRAVKIGITFMHIFEANWPEGFLNPITKQIVTFTWVGKPLKLCTETVYDPAVIIHGWVLGPQSKSQTYQY